MVIMSDVKIELHADDYGETHNTCMGILELMRSGCLDGVSILSNMQNFEDSASMLLDSVGEFPFVPYLSVHIDLVEGRSLDTVSGEGTDEMGMVTGDILPWDWKRLFLISFHIPVSDRSGHRMRYKDTFDRIKHEIRLQIHRASKLIYSVYDKADNEGITCKSHGLRIDSHQHAHLIPIVWKALIEVCREDDLKIEYIRTAHEPLGVFIRHLKLTWSPVGIIKNRILALLAPKAEKYMMSLEHKPAYLWGLVMTGHMDLARLESLMPEMLKKCKSKGYDLEINIHPGRMLDEELNEEIPAGSANDFYLKSDRDMEADTVRSFWNMMTSRGDLQWKITR